LTILRGWGKLDGQLGFVGKPSIQELIAMKKVSVLILIAILGVVGWTLPAGAEKIRMTDAELDGIAAGNGFPCGQVCIPMNKTGGVAGAGIAASGGLGPLHGTFLAGGAAPLAGGISANISASGHLSSPTGQFTINVTVPGSSFCINFGAGGCL
jgi:hypothetical protein